MSNLLKRRKLRQRHFYMRVKRPTTPSAPVFNEPTYLTPGALAQGAPSIAVPYPGATIPAGAIVLLHASNKLGGTSTPETPVGFKALKEIRTSQDNNGTNLGAVKLTTFLRMAEGGESGTVAVAGVQTDQVNSLAGQITVFVPDARAKVDIDVVDGGHDFMDHAVVASTTWTAKSHNKTDTRKGDLIFVCAAANTNLYTFSGKTLSQPGATFEKVADLFEYGVTAGNDQRLVGCLFRCVSTSPVNDYLTFQMESSGSAARNPAGVTSFVRIRQSVNDANYIPSRWRLFDPASFSNSDISTRGAIWGGNRADYEGALKSGEDAAYAIVERNGEKFFRMRANIKDALPVIEGGLNTPIQFRRETYDYWLKRTQLSWKLSRTSEIEFVDHPETPDQYIILQDHPGRDASWPDEWSNHPILSIEIAKANQYKVNTGSPAIYAPAGTMVICQNTRTTEQGGKYIVAYSNQDYVSGIPITVVGTKRIRIEMETCYGLAGSGSLFVRITDLTNNLVFTYFDNVAATVTASEDPALGGLGVWPLCGGASKDGLYLHQLDSVEDCRRWVNAGVNHIQLDYKYIGFALKCVTDHDYGPEFRDATFAFLRNRVVK